MRSNIFVVIVTYNSLRWINMCLKSIPEKYNIIIVDNNSSDTTTSFIKENFPNAILLQQSKNLGFGAGNNIGISYALKKGADFVFLLNQDAFVEPDTIEKLVKVANNNLDYGIISPIHLNADGTALESYFSQFVDSQNCPYFYSDFILKKEFKEIYELKFVNAAAWFIPKKILMEIGGFDPIFWHYGEDDNYCQRVKFHNYKIGVVPNAFIKHDSIIRSINQTYIFSDKFYMDYVKFLQVKYANINYRLSENAVSYEKNKIVKKFIENCLNRTFYSFRNYYKQFKLIDITFVGIIKSRNINKEKGSHYL